MTIDDPPLSAGAAQFVADLADEDHNPTVCGDVVQYSVVPAGGARAGRAVLTGVNTSELQGWPMAPPHWIHLQDDITLLYNGEPEGCPEGWRRHSRDTGDWDMSRKPIHLWISHVRGVLGEAI